MKKRSLLFSFSVLPMVALIMVIAVSSNRERSYIPRGSMTDRAVTGATEYWKTIRSNQVTGEVDIHDVLNALKEINQMNSAKSLSWSWDEMGPDNLGGRTRAILFDKTNPNIMYAGAVSGGLWKSTTAGTSWVKVPSVADNMIIACIAQAPNGDIYVGTGEGFYTNTSGGIGVGTGSGGFQGAGIYKSTDGNTFTQLANTATWTYINELAVNQTNGYVYAATKVGLKISSDGGANWSVTPTFSPTTSNMNADDVNIGNDGTTILVMNKNAYVAADGVSFTKVTGTAPTYSMPAAGSRMEVAIAPSDPNYMYAVLAAANGTTQGVYRSINKGSTWTQIAPAATTTFDIHRNQGDYDNAIEVYPNNKNKIIVGGINIWLWSDGGTWTQITSGSFSETSPLYVHVDIHEFAFHPTNPDIIYVGCDGGIHRSLNGGLTWSMMNKNFSTIQYYAITSSGKGQVMGGTQDNSYQFIDFKGNTPRSARELWAGDGGYAAISQINPHYMTTASGAKWENETYFVSGQYGSAARTVNNGVTWQKAYKGTTNTTAEFFNRRMLLEGTPGTNFSNFVTPLAIWESINAHDAKDSLIFVADTNYIAGEVIKVRSPHSGYPFEHTLLAGLNKEDSMMIQNPIQSMFVIAARTALWMTRGALDFSGTPQWYKIGTTTGGIIQTFTISNDGDHIFVGTSAGSLFRFSNIRQAYDSLSADVTSASQVITRTAIGSWSGRAITSIAIDPNNSNHVVVTLGNYGNTVFVYRSTNALDATPVFTSKQGTTLATRLPLMPVYSALITLNNPKMVIVGTEYGTYITEDITVGNPVWVEVNDGMDRVPTLMLHQQTLALPYTFVELGEDAERVLYEYFPTTNYGAIYAATHGRGAFRNLTYVGIEKPTLPKPSIFKSSLLLYPNPVQSDATMVFNLNSAGKVMVKVYDLTGKVVASMDAGTLPSGRNELTMNLSHLKQGNYIVQVMAGGESKTTKIIRK